MQKILSLGSKQFLSGIGISPYYEEAGIFDVLQGIDLWRTPGLLRPGYDRTIISGISDNPRWIVIAASSTDVKGYAYGDTGKMYQIHVLNDSVTNYSTRMVISSTAGMESQGQGLAIYKTELCYTTDEAFRTTSIPPVRVSDFKRGTLTDNAYHPIIHGPDNKLYILDKNTVDKWDGTTYTTDVLTLPGEFNGTCGANDGNYLVFGGSQAPNQAYNSDNCVVYFWDTWSPDINRKWTIRDERVINLRQGVDGWIYILTGKALWRCTYDNPPEQFLPKIVTNIDFSQSYGTTEIWNSNLLWGSGAAGACWAYGSSDKRLPPILHLPLYTSASGVSAVTAIRALSPTKVYVGCSTNKLFSFKSGNMTGTATTSLIDLKGTYKIEGIKVVTKALASGDSLDVQIQNEAGSNIIENKFSFSNEGAKTSKFIKTQRGANPITDQIIIDLDLTGAVQIKRIDVFGTPVIQEYAES